jgi:hypothetical protein
MVFNEGNGGVGKEGEGGLVGNGEAKKALVFDEKVGEGTGASEVTEKSEKVECDDNESVGLSNESRECEDELE